MVIYYKIFTRTYHVLHVFLIQVRQEKKGARKEIRKDMAFLSARKFQEQKLKDQDRMEKTKRILNGLATQEGDYQKIYKKQKKKF